MNRKAQMARVATGMALAGLCALPTGQAQVFVIVDVDMQPGVPGIQNTVAAAQNAAVSADLWLTLPAAAGHPNLAGYTFSVRYDNGELGLTAFPALGQIDPDGAGAWAVNAHNPGDEVAALPAPNAAWGEVSALGATDWSFGAAAFGPPKAWLAGSISFTAGMVNNDGLADVMPGLFDPRDGFINGAFVGNIPAGNLQFNPGFVVPEPPTAGIVLGALSLLGAVGIRRRAR